LGGAVAPPTLIAPGSTFGEQATGTDDDMRTAIATCVLEHILEHHFDPFFDRSRQIVTAGSAAFADTLRQCWRFDQAELPANTKRLDDLLKQIDPNFA